MQVAHRGDFDGLMQSDVLLTRKTLEKQSKPTQSLLRHGLCGGFSTGDHAAHWDEQAGPCKFCGETDSLQHRFWQCSATDDLRRQHAPVMSQHWDSFPPSFTLRAWALSPRKLVEFRQMLAAVPCDVPRLECRFFNDRCNHVFTDGSCIAQDQPLFRVAAWGAVLASPFERQWNFDYAGIIGAGPLPGLQQHAYRAELYAVAVVLHHAAIAQVPVHVWSDNAGVVCRCNLLIRGFAEFKVNSAHSDLWHWIEHSVRYLEPSRVQISKVTAHQDVTKATTLLEAWKWWNNNSADRLATMANKSRPGRFWQLWEEVSHEYQKLHALYREVIALHVAVAERSVQFDKQQTGDMRQVAAPRVTRVFPMQFDVSNWTTDDLGPIRKLYGSGLVDVVLAWWSARRQDAGESVPRWVAFVHLYIDFQMATGHPGPLKSGSNWLDVRNRPYLNGDKFPFLKRLRWFRQMMKGLWAAGQASIGMATNRACSEVLQTVVATASLPWSEWHLQRTEEWLARQLKAPCVRGTAALRSIPIAARDQTMSVDVCQPNMG